MKARLRQHWLTIHRWLGLTAGLLFVLLGLTGSLLVFDHAIDERLNPEMLLTDGAGRRRSLAEVIAVAENAYSKGPSRAAASSPRVGNGVWTVWFQSGAQDSPTFTGVYVDPYSAAVTGERVWGEDLMSTIYKLHYTLLGGDAGETVVGIAGLLLMLSIGSGLYLWRPLWKSGWRPAFAVRRGRRLVYDVHKLLGVLTAPILLVIAFTGVYMIFPEWINPMLAHFSEETKPPTNLKSTGSQSPQPITPDQAVEVARSHFPTASFCHLHPPQEAEGVYEVAVLQPDEVQRSFGRTQVWIDRFSGSIMAVRNPEDFTGADRFIAWQFPLHNGEAFGLLGRWIVFFTGLAPAALYITGLTLWARKRRSWRRRQESRLQNRSEGAY